MATVSAPRRAANRSSTTDMGLSLRIGGTSYDVAPIDPGEDGTRAYRLSKLGGAWDVYDVIRTHDGIVRCDCPDYEARHAGTSATCKHGRALVSFGLVEAPWPVAGTRGLVVRRDPGRPFGEGLEDDVEGRHVPPARPTFPPTPAPEPEPTPEPEPEPESEDDLRARLAREERELRARIEAEYPVEIDMEAESFPEPEPEPASEPKPEVARTCPRSGRPLRWTGQVWTTEPGDPLAASADDAGQVVPEPEPIPPTPAVAVSVDPPAPADRMTLEAWIAHVAAGFRALDTEAGDLVADHVAKLAALVELTKARDVATYRDRIATYDR